MLESESRGQWLVFSQRMQTCRDVSAPMVELGVTSPLVSVDRITPFFRLGPGRHNTRQNYSPFHATLYISLLFSTTTIYDWNYSELGKVTENKHCGNCCTKTSYWPHDLLLHNCQHQSTEWHNTQQLLKIMTTIFQVLKSPTISMTHCVISEWVSKI